MLCVYIFCGSRDDLLVKENILKVVFKDMGFRLSSDIEIHRQRLYEARRAG
jgi:hypothetical protein